MPVVEGEEGDGARAKALPLHDNAVAQVAHHAARHEGVQRLAQPRRRWILQRRHLCHSQQWIVRLHSGTRMSIGKGIRAMGIRAAYNVCTTLDGAPSLSGIATRKAQKVCKAKR